MALVLRGTTKFGTKGVGLGLSLAEHIIHEMDGELSYDKESIFPKFTIALPNLSRKGNEKIVA